MNNLSNESSRIRHSVEANLSGLTLSPREQARLVDAVVHQGRRPRRLSTALAVALALMLLSATAFAFATWRTYAATIPAIEQQEGQFAQWSATQKAELVRQLADNGYLSADDDVARLLAMDSDDPNLGALADAIVMRFTGADDAREISFISILQSVWGDWADWTHEQRAFASQAESVARSEAGFDTDGYTVYGDPAQDGATVTEEQAVESARAKIADLLALSDREAARYVASASDDSLNPGNGITYEAQTEDGGLHQWSIELHDEGDGLPLRTIHVYVDARTGEVQPDLAESLLLSMKMQWYHEHQQEIDPLYYGAMGNWPREHGSSYFPGLTVEQKAEFTSLFRDDALAYLAAHPGYDTAWVIGVSAFAYGLPDEDAISQEAALDAAYAELMRLTGLSEEVMRAVYIDDTYGSDVCIFYDVTDPDRPLWKFTLEAGYDSGDAFEEMIEAYGQPLPWMPDQKSFHDYKIELDAHTGEVVRAFTFDSFLSFGNLQTWLDRL